MRGKASGSLSNRRERPLLAPACDALDEFVNFNGYGGFWFRVLVAVPQHVFLHYFSGLIRDSKKPRHLSKETGFRKDRGAQRRGQGHGFEAAAVCDPEARGQAAALRSATRIRRRVQILGGGARPFARSA